VIDSSGDEQRVTDLIEQRDEARQHAEWKRADWLTARGDADAAEAQVSDLIRERDAALELIENVRAAKTAELFGKSPEEWLRIEANLLSAQAQVRLLKEALEFYADRANYAARNPRGSGAHVWNDEGEKARAALAAAVEEGDRDAGA
jgi:hypothetical protein